MHITHANLAALLAVSLALGGWGLVKLERVADTVAGLVVEVRELRARMDRRDSRYGTDTEGASAGTVDHAGYPQLDLGVRADRHGAAGG